MERLARTFGVTIGEGSMCISYTTTLIIYREKTSQRGASQIYTHILVVVVAELLQQVLQHIICTTILICLSSERSFSCINHHGIMIVGNDLERV